MNRVVFCLAIFLSLTISGFLAVQADAKGVIIMAPRVNGEIPLDPANPAWNAATSVKVPLTMQVMAKPRLYEGEIKELEVKAIQNGKEIAFLLEWQDKTEDTRVDLGSFSDAAAIEFPAASAAGTPHFAMGDEEDPVNIWYWKAAWQNSGTDSKEKPVSVDDYKEYSPVLKVEKYATIDNIALGIMAGNPVSNPKHPPVENLVAQGFGTLGYPEKAGKQNISGIGKWNSGKWSVVFKRSITDDDKNAVSFSEGRLTPAAFALWNGSEGMRGGMKALSTWFYVGFETEKKPTAYVFPMLAFAGTLGLEMIIIAFRKRAKG